MVLRVTSRLGAHAVCDEDISHLISVQDPHADLSDLRPASIPRENHLVLTFGDVNEPHHPLGPKETHLRQLLDWVRDLDPEELRGLLVHCDSGISRSTASAWLALVLLAPDVPPHVHLERVAVSAYSEFCWPNDLIVALADKVLEREGALVQVLAAWKSDQDDQA